MEPSSPPPPTQAPAPSLCEEAGPLPPEAQSGMEQLWVPRKVAPNKEEGAQSRDSDRDGAATESFLHFWFLLPHRNAIVCSDLISLES